MNEIVNWLLRIRLTKFHIERHEFQNTLANSELNTVLFTNSASIGKKRQQNQKAIMEI